MYSIIVSKVEIYFVGVNSFNFINFGGVFVCFMSIIFKFEVLKVFKLDKLEIILWFVI